MSVTRQAHPGQRGEAIPEATRLRLYQLQVEIRYCESGRDRLLAEREVARALHQVLQEQVVGALFAIADFDLQLVQSQPRRFGYRLASLPGVGLPGYGHIRN